MEDAGIPFQKVHHMFVTHGHTDHIMGAVWVIRKITALINSGSYHGDFHI